MPASDLSRLVDGGWVDRGPDDVRVLVNNRLHCSASFGRAPLGLGFAAAVIPPEAEGDKEVDETRTQKLSGVFARRRTR
jgi:hypothetical protein